MKIYVNYSISAEIDIPDPLVTTEPVLTEIVRRMVPNSILDLKEFSSELREVDVIDHTGKIVFSRIYAS